MKRSAMLEQIHNKLDGIEMNENWTDQILTVIEDLGMLPPFTGKFRQQNIIDRWGRDTGKTEYGRVIVNEWEPEA